MERKQLIVCDTVARRAGNCKQTTPGMSETCDVRGYRGRLRDVGGFIRLKGDHSHSLDAYTA